MYKVAMDTEKQHSVRGEVNRLVLAPRQAKSPSNPAVRRHRTCLLGVQTSDSNHIHTLIQAVSEHTFSKFTIALKHHFGNLGTDGVKVKSQS
jgi:hypothetical protein